MRCLSPSPRYSIQAFEGNEQIVVDARGFATTIVHEKPVICDFHQGGLLDHEIEAALENFNFSGIPEGVNPLTRVAFFDTEAYGERFRPAEREDKIASIDIRLRELAAIYPSEFIIVDMPASEKPWPSYDTDTAVEIQEFQRRLGISPEVVRLYEVENRNRKGIVSAMLRLDNPEAAEEQYGPVGAVEKEEEIVVGA